MEVNRNYLNKTKCGKLLSQGFQKLNGEKNIRMDETGRGVTDEGHEESKQCLSAPPIRRNEPPAGRLGSHKIGVFVQALFRRERMRGLSTRPHPICGGSVRFKCNQTYFLADSLASFASHLDR